MPRLVSGSSSTYISWKSPHLLLASEPLRWPRKLGNIFRSVQAAVSQSAHCWRQVLSLAVRSVCVTRVLSRADTGAGFETPAP